MGRNQIYGKIIGIHKEHEDKDVRRVKKEKGQERSWTEQRKVIKKANPDAEVVKSRCAGKAEKQET